MTKPAIAYSEFIIKDVDGGFSIYGFSGDTKICISRVGGDCHGEGMQIETSQLMEVIRKFYELNF